MIDRLRALMRWDAGPGFGLRGLGADEPANSSTSEHSFRVASTLMIGGVMVCAIVSIGFRLVTGYRPAGFHPWPPFLMSLFGMFSVWAVYRHPHLFPRWAFESYAWFLGLGVAIVTFFFGPLLSPMPAFAYAPLAVAAAVFFSRKAVVAFLFVIAVTYAVSLAVQPGNHDRVPQWLTVMLTTTLVGLVTGYLVDRTRALAVAERQARTEAEEAKAALEVVNRHKSEFLASMSHELRTPLNAVIGFGEVLDEGLFGELNDKQAEYVGDIVTSGHHLLSLINDVLDLSKVEAGRMDLELSEVSVPELLTSSVGLFREQAARHAIDLQLRLDSQVGELCCDERKVRQVTFNLLSNAVKFTPEGGRVELSAARRNGAVEIAVSDTGPGIAVEDQEHIFEEFAQARTSGNGRGPSTGLGLALARRFVELHGGTIGVESTPGQGATFRFSLPVDRPS